MLSELNPRQFSSHDRDLADALEACDAIGRFHDRYPLGIPGRVKWEEAVEKVSAMGARVIALGLRQAVTHKESASCLKTIAHVSGGALVEVSSLDASLIGPLTASIIEQSLDQQLIDEEVCDLILCFKNDFEEQSKEDRRRNLVESMSQAAKNPHRLHLMAGPSQDQSRLMNQGSTSGLNLMSASRRSDVSSSNQSIDNSKSDDQALLGMISIRFDDRVLDQVLASLRNKAERTSRCLITNFESPEEWLEFQTSQNADGMYRRERNKVSDLTSPLSLRYIVAVHIMAIDNQ